jgi:hypothetical protein
MGITSAAWHETKPFGQAGPAGGYRKGRSVLDATALVDTRQAPGICARHLRPGICGSTLASARCPGKGATTASIVITSARIPSITVPATPRGQRATVAFDLLCRECSATPLVKSTFNALPSR